MTHFRPICLMPLSVPTNADNIISVPPLRQKTVKVDTLKIYKPIKTKFRKKLTSVHRRSAFCIFQAIKPLLNVSRIIGQNDRTEATAGANARKASASKQPSLSDEFQSKAQIQLSSISQYGRSQKLSTKIQPLRKSGKPADVGPPRTVRSNRDRAPPPEKEDIHIQECIDMPSTRYSLRSRNKSSVSSLSSSSSSDLGKSYPLAACKFKKSITSVAESANELAARGQRNAANTDKYMDFSFQKLTRSRRIAMTMTGA